LMRRPARHVRRVPAPHRRDPVSFHLSSTTDDADRVASVLRPHIA
jgi:hypothetical protein